MLIKNNEIFLTKLIFISMLNRTSFISILAAIAVFLMIIPTSTIPELSNYTVLAVEKEKGNTQQQQQNQTSLQHNAKGHQNHQVVNLQYPIENALYNGSVIFKASKPVDIIAYNATMGLKNSEAANTWDINGTIYKPITLLQNSSEGNLKFHASGLVTYSPLSQPYTVTFNINSTENDLGED
jgi:hypothetical protein